MFNIHKIHSKGITRWVGNDLITWYWPWARAIHSNGFPYYTHLKGHFFSKHNNDNYHNRFKNPKVGPEAKHIITDKLELIDPIYATAYYLYNKYDLEHIVYVKNVNFDNLSKRQKYVIKEALGDIPQADIHTTDVAFFPKTMKEAVELLDHVRKLGLSTYINNGVPVKTGRHRYKPDSLLKK